jgi:(p)ppGpp synthase/HD superfamily hydrolase
MSNEVAIAEHIARKGHAGQKRRGGLDAITHTEAVVERLKDEKPEVRAAAWLHDLLEDTPTTADDLLAAGLSPAVVEAVVALTHARNEPYTAYILRVRANPIARKVKIADMLDNLSGDPTERQILKYEKGLKLLLD